MSRPGVTREFWIGWAYAAGVMVMIVLAGLAFGKPLPDLAPCEVGMIPVGGHFRHDGELWVRLSPDPARPAGDTDRPLCLVARLSGPESGLGVPRPMFSRAWVRPVHVNVVRVREPWE